MKTVPSASSATNRLIRREADEDLPAPHLASPLLFRCAEQGRGTFESAARLTPDGRYVMAVFEELDGVTIMPVTAYEVSKPR